MHFSIKKGHKGVVEIVKRLLAEDGWRGFMRGAVARLGFIFIYLINYIF